MIGVKHAWASAGGVRHPWRMAAVWAHVVVFGLVVLGLEVRLDLSGTVGSKAYATVLGIEAGWMK